jgi:hypothetical protein
MFCSDILLGLVYNLLLYNLYRCLWPIRLLRRRGRAECLGRPRGLPTGLTGRLRDHTLKGLANKTLIRNSLTSRTGFHGLK